jgi:hypothetical protein
VSQITLTYGNEIYISLNWVSVDFEFAGTIFGFLGSFDSFRNFLLLEWCWVDFGEVFLVKIITIMLQQLTCQLEIIRNHTVQ